MSSNDKAQIAFDSIHPKLQKWVYGKKWDSLREAQWKAIPFLLDGNTDLIIAAATAAGKTEAAFLPILSTLAFAADSSGKPNIDPWEAHDPWAPVEEPKPFGLQVLYLSPLKALINDQYSRLDEMCETVNVPVHRWHGDVSSSAKQKVLKEPSGVLLITPESLEATFVNRGSKVSGLFAGLRYIVVDEMHSFMGEARGAQLQSLMNRTELAIRRPVQRVGLSATLSDLSAGREFLRPSRPESVAIVESKRGNQVSLQVRGYTETKSEAKDEDDLSAGGKAEIADHIFRNLRGSDNLVFINSPKGVEEIADLLRRKSEDASVPNQFWPHHGSLSKELREAAEESLKSQGSATVICTSTLEMGIDVGDISSTAQIGKPPSVSSLKQRLGRSGRRDEPSAIRIYITERELDERSELDDQLRLSTFQVSAMLDLMIEKWLEPNYDPGFNYSTLVQQALSVISQHGGATADQLFRSLCGPGPFSMVDSARFTRLLRAMGAKDLIIQASDGLILHGHKGELLVNNYEFYAAFQSVKEWRLVTNGRTLGRTIDDFMSPIYLGQTMIVGGRRWKVVAVDSKMRVIDLLKTSGGKAPDFGSPLRPEVSDRVRQQMRSLYEEDSLRAWQDTASKRFMTEGRSTYKRYELSKSPIIAELNELTFVHWMGDRSALAAAMMLQSAGINARPEGPFLQLTDVTSTGLSEALNTVLASPIESPEVLGAFIENPEFEKWDWVLDDEHLAESAGVKKLSIPGGRSILQDLVSHLQRTQRTEGDS